MVECGVVIGDNEVDLFLYSYSIRDSKDILSKKRLNVVFVKY